MDIPTIDAVLRVKTQQIILSDAASILDVPLRRWRVEICMLDSANKETEANILSSCTFHLHPTFEDPIREVNTPPFALQEEGWGQFEFKIICLYIENAGKFTIKHPLLFEDDAYAIDYDVHVPYHTPKLRSLLAGHYKLPQNTVQKYLDEKDEFVSLNWINSIPALDEDAVTPIVQMIVSHPAVQNEVFQHPRHEDFLMALYQLPNELLKEIRDYVSLQTTVSNDLSDP